MYIAMMMCRLYRKENTTHFFLPWVPIIHTMAEGYSFDLAKILFDSLTSEITECQTQKDKGQSTSFLMSTYIMDAICFIMPFPLMGWRWNPDSVEPIHIYHSKIWEDKETDFFYEICNWVVVSMHIVIFGHSPPRILDILVANLDKVTDWYIEEHFSYIKVFGCSVPPYSLPQFLLDRLVCCNVVRQTILGGISKEIRVVKKKVWPYFQLQIGAFSLLDFGHSKVEAVALEEINLVNIEFKKHDLQKFVGNHMANCNLKRCEHEECPQDEVFRGVRSYQEFMGRVRALSPNKMIDFYNFQKHQISCLTRGKHNVSNYAANKDPKSRSCKL
jgi:hypothetical protein